MAQSNAVQSFICALTGLTPLTDPVVTPSGYVCSRRLLLTKLSENGGVDPFDGSGSRRLDESSLVGLNTAGGIAGGLAANPPRPPKASSLPNLMGMIQTEFEAVLLELYDTRMALEETRRELSSALYQNDAAVRVVARLAMERDEARGKLEGYLMTDGGAKAPPAQVAVEPTKRGRDDETLAAAGGGESEESGVAAKKKAKVDDSAGTLLTAIPSMDLNAMNETWTVLTKNRRAISKLKRTDDETAANVSLLADLGSKGETKKVNLGKSNAKAGILCMSLVTAAFDDESEGEEYLITSGHDKTAIVYHVNSGSIHQTLSGATKEVVTVHGKALLSDDEEEGMLWVVTGSTDGHIRLYCVILGGRDGESSLLVATAKLDKGTPVNVVVHPSSTATQVRLLVASSEGRMELYKFEGVVRNDDAEWIVECTELKLVTRLEHPSSGEGETTKYTAGCMHPDGFIYIAGTDDGHLIVWDLKTQAVAGTLKGGGGGEGGGGSVGCIAISENGYHVATSTAGKDSSIQIWDLRKLKSIASIVPGDDVGNVVSVAFDPTATYLTYTGEVSTKVCVVKDWEKVVCTLNPSKTGGSKKKKTGGLNGGVVWGGKGFGPLEGGEEGKVWLATGCDGERPVHFWGVE
jgi:pre-mRNA-processing factor 19